MATSTNEQITIDLPTDIKTALERKAKGKDIKSYIQSIIKKQALSPSLEEILAPVRREFAGSGMSEDDLDTFMDSVRNNAHQGKPNG